MTEFWKAKDAFAYFGTVMKNPRSSWSARSPDGRVGAVSVRRNIVVIGLALLAAAAVTAADAAGLPGPVPTLTIRARLSCRRLGSRPC